MTVATGTGSSLMGGITLSAGDIFTVAIDPDTLNEEICYITARSGDSFTIDRAEAGTVGVVHAAGATVRHVLSSDDLNYFNQAIQSTTAPGFTPTISGGSASAISTQMQIRRDTAANWTSSNPTLAAGEIGFETDTNKFKIGTGAAVWASLSYGVQDPVTTKGDLYTFSTTDARLPVGANNTVLTADSAEATGLKWSSPFIYNLKEVVFTSSNATYTIPTGVTGILALCVGAGGGGGASSTASVSNCGGSGGAGQVRELYFTVSGGDTQLNITVPTGGAGGTAGGKGSSGSAATIVGVTSGTTYVSAAGGGGGGGGASANVAGISGASGGGNGSNSSTNQGGGGGGMVTSATNQALGLFGNNTVDMGGGASATTMGVTGFAGGDQDSNYGGAGIIVFGRALAGGGNNGTGTSLSTSFGAAVGGTTIGGNATANTGAGGGGAKTSASTANAGGNGGSGLVVLRFVGV
jgi:hypothetical protein